MTKINQFRNLDIKRQERDLTNRQKKIHQALIEGTIVNSYAKDRDDAFAQVRKQGRYPFAVILQ